jgi:hypothetical protein
MSLSNITRYFALAVVGFMAVGYVVILIFKMGDKEPKPMMSERSRVVFWLSALGIPAFLLGLALPVLPTVAETRLGNALFVPLLAGGFLAVSASVFLNAAFAKSKRSAWPVVPARCTGQQLQKKRFSTGDGSSDGWLWSVACEVNYGGKNYVVFPKVHWSDFGQADAPFGNEAKAREFISQKISPKGECQVRINPNNPLEAELL